jgi:hypothetical protein
MAQQEPATPTLVRKHRHSLWWIVLVVQMKCFMTKIDAHKFEITAASNRKSSMLGTFTTFALLPHDRRDSTSFNPVNLWWSANRWPAEVLGDNTSFNPVNVFLVEVRAYINKSNVVNGHCNYCDSLQYLPVIWLQYYNIWMYVNSWNSFRCFGYLQKKPK